MSYRFSSSIWDGGPINGHTVDELKATGMPLPKDNEFAYCIRDKEADRVVYFQAFDPTLEGYKPMTRERAEAAGLAQAKTLEAGAKIT